MMLKYIKRYPKAVIVVYAVIIILCLTGIGNMYGSTIDWVNQHTVFPELFRTNFYESGNLFSNFLYNIGGGQNVFNFAYYGYLSPVFLPSYALPFVSMTTYVMVVSGLLYIASGLLTYEFIKHHFGKQFGFLSAILILTSSPMNYHFHHHTMFVAYMPFLIMALMGIDRLFEKKKCTLFVVSAVLVIFTNYYYSVCSLVCLFAYAVYRLIKKHQDCFKFSKFFKEFWYQVYIFVIPIMISALILLPVAYSLVSNGRSYDVSVDLYSLVVPEFMENFISHFAPAVTGSMFVALVAQFSHKKKDLASRFLSAFLLILILCPVFTYILNGALYVRGKVLIPLLPLLVFMLCLFLSSVKQNTDEKYLKNTFLYSIVISAFFSLFRIENFIVVALIAASCIGIWFFRKKVEAVFGCVIAVLLISSVVINFTEVYVTYDYYKSLQINETKELLSDIDTRNLERSQVFHDENSTSNMIYAGNYNNSSVYSSTSNQSYQNFYESYMGNNEGFRTCFMVIGGRSELFHTFMGTKYIVSQSDPGIYYDLVKEGEHLNLYENENPYPVMYKSASLLNESDFDELMYPYSAQALFENTVVSDDRIPFEFESKIEKIDVNSEYEFFVAGPEPEKYDLELDEKYRNKILYLSFDVNTEVVEENYDVYISICGVRNLLTVHDYIYFNGNNRFDYCISLEDDTSLEIELSAGLFKIENLKMYVSDKFDHSYVPAENISFDKGKDSFSCSLDANEGEYLVTSIPYCDGFTAYVNGREADVEVVNKAFVGVKLLEGNNDIVIRYEAPFFKAGVYVSLVGLALFVFEVLRRKIWRNCSKNIEK